MKEKVLIIGSGPAAWTAALYTARAALSPLVFEGAVTSENQESGTLPMGQLSRTTEVENYPGFPAGSKIGAYIESALDSERYSYLMPNEGDCVTGPELVELMRRQAENFGTRIIGEDIVRVDFSGGDLRVTDSASREYEASSIIIATGASARYLGLASEEQYKNRGVSACAVCDGALPRFRNHPVAVVGGGDSAVEEADYLAKFASKVYLIHRRDELRASKTMAERAKRHPKIEIMWNRVPDEILGSEETGVTGVVLKSTVGDEPITLDVTGVFMAIGHTPNTKFLNGALELTDKGFIKRTIPFRTNTSVPGVFVAGDVADDYYKQAITAAGSGCQAGLDAERYLASLE